MRRRPALQAGLSVVPLIFAVPVLYGIAATLRVLLSTAHPYFGDAAGLDVDGLNLHLGGPLYGDPGRDYPMETYTPIVPLLVAALDGVRVWSGWTLLITMMASLALVGLAAVLAWRPAQGPPWVRVAAAAGAVGMGAIAWWIVAAVPFNFLYLGRADHLAWAFAFAGLALVPRARGSFAAGAASVALLSLAFWTKQTAFAAPAAATLWMVASAVRGRTSPGAAGLFCGSLLVVNLALLGVLQVGTEGGIWTYIVSLPTARGRVMGYGEAVVRMLRACGIGAVVAAGMWIAVLAGGERAPDRRRQVATVLLVFLAVELAAAPYFREAVGSVDNHFTGVAWCLGLLAAIGWGLAEPRMRSAAVAAGVVLAAFAFTEIRTLQRLTHDRLEVDVPPKVLRGAVGEESFGLRELARRRALYHPIYSYLAAERLGRPSPTVYALQVLIAAGRPGGQLVDDILERRFDIVFALEDEGPRKRDWGGAHYEDDYIWKLDQAIRAKYAPASRSLAVDSALVVPADIRLYRSPGAFVRRPGPDPAPWIDRCFAPFHIAGATWRIRSGGGFWCLTRPRGSTLRLVRTRAARSEVVSDVRTGPGARIGASVRRRGVVVVRLGAWRRRLLLAAGGRRTVALPSGRDGMLSITATRASVADLDLARASGGA